jgi:predicted glycosyltransferase
MNGENINIPANPLRVLISPLHWGLGHATRIIPIIKLLKAANVEVVIAAKGSVAVLLQREFPQLLIIEAPAVTVQYPQESKWFFFKMLTQAPAILNAIKKENNWIKKAVAENRIDAVISDNRFGFYVKTLPCVFITHQLFINAPNGVLRWIAQKINYSYIGQFKECWVPDVATAPNLAGRLSHPQLLPAVPLKYLGALSRLKKSEHNNGLHILILLSGPEPQRSIWEAALMPQLKSLGQPAVLVRGLPAENDHLSSTAMLSIYNHVDAHQLNSLMNDASVVVARSGYSTVMDVVAVGKRSILVPTPGQGEQEYLADYLKEQKIAYTVKQQGFDLTKALEEARHFKYNIPAMDFETGNQQVVNDWLVRVRFAKEQQ